ncbi:uncharacterized protein LOC111444370 [Cucurbita moschata]|uniref:Uncharacterized protein LOC111444370 n=1 Tax=Cucurbita moschata TaxID=3662 RepID=A0A6J1FJ53_CUCMO|nr:uncharacterized protein LOC111444370 [Cucurbita moschata]
MANAWKRDKSPRFLSPIFLFFLFSFSILILFFFLFGNSSPMERSAPTFTIKPHFSFPTIIAPFDCFKCPQSYPVIANVVEGVRYPFLFSIADLGNLPDKPHKNIVRMLKGKPFRKPDISVTIQEVLEKMKGGDSRDGFVVDVGANVGMASFAAAAMGFRVLAFEPVFENLQRICDGIYLNRVGELVNVFQAAASDNLGNITVHKLVGRLDNSAVSAAGAKLAFKSNEEIAVQVQSIPLDEVIPDSEQVLLIKIDVQGWEYHVLKGAKQILSRKGSEAPYLIYEEDERLLKASNSSKREIREFLHSVGYHTCIQHGTDAHCTKTT